MKGVENVVLTQRDGNPIQYSGIWLSKDEIFNVSASTSAIFNCALQLYDKNLKYVLIEGKRAKILISPLKNYGSKTLNKIIKAQGLQENNEEFFVAITTRPNINLGGVLLKTRQQLIEIKKSLILSGSSFKPPLKHYNKKEVDNLIDSLNVKDNIDRSETLNLFSFNISQNTYTKLDKILDQFKNQTSDLKNTYITLKGGFTVANSSINNDDLYSLDTEAVMTYSLFSTANKTAWLLKKMSVDSILIECVNCFQFINSVGDGIFSATILKGGQKLGLLRLLIPRYCKKINTIIESEKIQKKETHMISNFKNMFSELVF